jgi:PD-(D/E)XK endonuclease
VRLVAKRIGNGWQWVVETSAGEDECSLAGGANEDSAGGTQFEGIAGKAHKKDERNRATIPFLCAMADPGEKWWERVRGNPKRSGEISQAAFLSKASMMGFNLALPWGDSERWDFVVWGRDQPRVMRVQVKGTGRLYLGGYEVQPVHSTRRGGKKRYTKKEIDVIAAHVQPLDAWYLIPIEAVGRAKSLRLYPESVGGEGPSVVQAKGKIPHKSHRSRKPDWERWRNAWQVLDAKPVGN